MGFYDNSIQADRYEARMEGKAEGISEGKAEVLAELIRTGAISEDNVNSLDIGEDVRELVKKKISRD